MRRKGKKASRYYIKYEKGSKHPWWVHDRVQHAIIFECDTLLDASHKLVSAKKANQAIVRKVREGRKRDRRNRKQVLKPVWRDAPDLPEFL